MNDLFNENNEPRIPEENINGSFVSLEKTESPSVSGAAEAHPETAAIADSGGFPEAYKAEEIGGVSGESASQNFDILPGEETDDRSYRTENYGAAQSNPYGANVPQPAYGNYPSAYGKPPKERMSSGLKSYLIVIVGITIIFVLGFVYECVHTYNEKGMFGGDIDRFLDYYGNYDFDWGLDDDDSDEEDSDGFVFDIESDTEEDDDFSDYDYIDKNDSDNSPTELKEAPDKNTVVNKNAAVFKTKDQPDDIDSVEYTARKAFKKVADSVVNVVVYDGEVGNEDDAQGSGTGIIISQDGYIVTNSHVINDSGTYGVEIILNNGDSYAAAIVGYDSRTDIAVLKIDAKGLSAAEFVNSDQIEVGQDAIAVGNPGGQEYSNSLTKGCVSALNRTVSSNRLVSYIQTDAAINPGNSGGPLLNSAGQVMGITTIKIANTDYEGMGFAIPSNTVIEIVNDLVGQGYVSNRVRLGITGVPSSSEMVMTTLPDGIVIKEIADDSCFKGTDVKVDDVITAIDGQKLKSFTELFSILANYQPGDTVTVSIYRPSASRTVNENFDVEITLIADNGETQNYQNSDN